MKARRAAVVVVPLVVMKGLLHATEGIVAGAAAATRDAKIIRITGVNDFKSRRIIVRIMKGAAGRANTSASEITEEKNPNAVATTMNLQAKERRIAELYRALA